MKAWLKRVRAFLWRLFGIDFEELRATMQLVRAKQRLEQQDWVRLGEHSFSNGARAERFTETESLTIGKYCSIAWDVFFLTGAGIHNPQHVSTFPFLDHLHDDDEPISLGAETRKVREWNEHFAYSRGPITIGNDVWISMRAVIQSGVTIGNGAVILANAVVTKDIPAYAIAGGVPAKVVGYRFPPEVIEKLEQIAWWDWPEASIRAREADFYLPVDEFIQKYGAA